MFPIFESWYLHPENLERCSVFWLESSFSVVCGRINYTCGSVGERVKLGESPSMWKTWQACSHHSKPPNRVLYHSSLLLEYNTTRMIWFDEVGMSVHDTHVAGNNMNDDCWCSKFIFWVFLRESATTSYVQIPVFPLEIVLTSWSHHDKAKHRHPSTPKPSVYSHTEIPF